MGTLRRLAGDERGNLLVFFGLSAAALLGMVALSFDLGRVASTQTELQSFADNVALAAAGELDGASDAITRAQTAAAELIEDTQTFGSGGSALDIADVTLTFLSALDTSDMAPPYEDTVIEAPYSAADAADAIFVRVDIDPHTVPLTFASAFSGLSGNPAPNSTVAATATAGFTQYACDIAPLMFCLPPGGVERGQMIYLVSGGGSGAWGPGNFGYLDIRDIEEDEAGPCGSLKGAQRIRCSLGAIEHITACYSIRGVDTKTGSSVGIMTDPINYRFDMFPNSASTEQDDENFAPAPNTIRGFVPDVKVTGSEKDPKTTVDWCKAGSGTPTSMAMPHDSSLSNENRFGTDTAFEGAEREAYVAMNYGGVDPFEDAETRWEYYQAESEAHGGASSSEAILAAATPPAYRETGRAMCSAHQSDDYERRLLVAAGVNCDPAAGGTEIKGDTNGVPVEEFYHIFLTEPVGLTGGSGMYIYGEVVEVVGGSGSTPTGIFHDVVQLYR